MNQLKKAYKKVSRNDLIRSHAKQGLMLRQSYGMMFHMVKRWLADKTDCEKCRSFWK